MTATEISIGVAINDAAFAQMYNAGIGVDLGDPLRAAQVVADILNEQGGVAGRRIRLINYRHTGDSNAYAAQVCARFTEEVQVFTVLQFSPSGPTTRKCFGDRRMPVIDGFSSAVSARDALPHHYGIASMTLERLATTLVDRLHATGFFARGKRIGVVTYDDEVHRRVVSQVLVPRLERHSRNVTAIAHLKGGLGDEANAANAVTAFRRDRVELVIIFEGGAGVSGPFTHAAAAQQASFGYGLASVTHPSAQAHGRKYLVHEDALRRATVVGWSPLSDLRYDRGGVRELPPLAHDWRRRLAARGLTYRESCCALGAALVMVDRLRFLKAGLEAVQGEGVGRERLRAGVEGLGSTFSSVLTTRTEFRPGRHDGAAAVRYASWDDACGCLTYRSGAIPLPR